MFLTSRWLNIFAVKYGRQIIFFLLPIGKTDFYDLLIIIFHWKAHLLIISRSEFHWILQFVFITNLRKEWNVICKYVHFCACMVYHTNMQQLFQSCDLGFSLSIIGIFLNNPKPSLSRPFSSLPLCSISEKPNEQIDRKKEFEQILSILIFF